MTASHQELPEPATSWQLRTRTLRFGRIPTLMGIVNVTPDSFSDGGLFVDASLAVEHALGLVAAGAAILDVGGESTRPYSESVSTDEELKRVLPILDKLVRATQVPISIDTSKAEVARRALELGVEIVNDVTGLQGDPAMLELVRNEQPGVCVMHMQGTPQTMQENPQYDDVVGEIHRYLRDRIAHITAAGVDASRICVDPGIGFGKTHEHNLTLLTECGSLHELGCPVLIGHSRKGFIGKLVGKEPSRRRGGSVGVALALARKGIQVLRVHDVSEVAAALCLFDAIGGVEKVEG